MPALDRVAAWRVVTTPDALSAARWQGDDVTILRLAPDEALGLGATGVEVTDSDAVVEPEVGFSVARLSRDDELRVHEKTEWVVPATPGTLAQGKVAGVPAKLLIGEPTILVVQTCFAADLMERLGW